MCLVTLNVVELEKYLIPFTDDTGWYIIVYSIGDWLIELLRTLSDAGSRMMTQGQMTQGQDTSRKLSRELDDDAES